MRLHTLLTASYGFPKILPKPTTSHRCIMAVILEKLGICNDFVVRRFLINGVFPPGPCDLSIKETLFDTVPVRIYQSKTPSPEKRRGLVWIHGGGGIFGGLESHERLCRFFAQESATVVLAIGYPLAPEHPYPAQQHSCYVAVLYFLKHAGDFGMDPQRIVLGGDSTGGAIVAAISQQLVLREDLPQVRAHVLAYPFLQALDFNLPSYQQNQWVPPLFKTQIIHFGKFYLTRNTLGADAVMFNAHVPEKLRIKYQKWISAELIPEEFKARGYVPFVPGRFSEALFKECAAIFEATFSPLLTEDAILRQFPETFLLTCEYDILRDEGLLYKKRLEDNGVSVTWHHLEDGFHGILLLLGFGPLEFPGTKSSLKSIIQFLERY
ncbi:arylacetamide deacetylase-like 4 [Pseudonaja textilis]|uniref:arylacetamide deacetylase-like 4 n=1 Tax=Pseudonaja textilis TaxID=8673 RepID=UPI000EA96FE9|nr:arylacetamide deacetylase-like 4 [Pseudonaja textilis]